MGRMSPSARALALMALLGLRGGGLSAAGAIEVPLKDAIKAGDSVHVLVDATNPQAGTVSDLKVYTTSNQTAGQAAPYTIDTVAESNGQH